MEAVEQHYVTKFFVGRVDRSGRVGWSGISGVGFYGRIGVGRIEGIGKVE